MSACMKVGCPAAATHSIKIVVPDEDDERRPAEAGIPMLTLCKAHAEEFPVSHLFEVSPSLKGLIRTEAGPGGRPDFDLAFIEAIPVGGVEHQAFTALASPQLS